MNPIASVSAHEGVQTQIRRLLQLWLVLGAVLVLLLPAARGSSNWFGWMPYWLLCAPAMMLLLQRLRMRIAPRPTTQSRRRQRPAALPQVRERSRMTQRVASLRAGALACGHASRR